MFTLRVDDGFMTRVISLLRWWIRTAAIATGTLPGFRSIWRLSYHAQLALAVRGLSRVPYFQALILRRRQVLEDLHGGDSDLDLTLLLAGDTRTTAPHLPAIWATYRQLKQWIPVLGELHILPAADFPAHLRSFPFDYELPQSPCLLKGELPELLPDELRSVGWRLRTLLFPRLFDQLRPARFLRPLQKLWAKAIWLRDFSRQPTTLDYRRALAQKNPYGTGDDYLDWARRTYHAIASQLERVGSSGRTFKYAGEAPALPVSLAQLRPAAEELLLKCPTIVTGFTIAPAVLYASNWSVFISVPDIDRALQDRTFVRHLFQLQEHLKTCAEQMQSTMPTVLTPAVEDSLFGDGTTLALALRSGRYDLTSAGFVPVTATGGYLAPDEWSRGLLEVRMDAFSLPRRECSAYLMDLLFGLLIPFGLLRKEQCVYRSFRALERDQFLDAPWSAAQRELLALYREGRMRELERVPTVHVWYTWGDLILKHLEALRV
jgi:hypothetical protein